MTLFAEDVDDVGEVGLGRLRDHVSGSRAVMAHPHVERAAKTKREAAVGLVELHRGHPDIHHNAIDQVDALRGANFGQIRKPVLDQREPPLRSIDQVEPGRYSGSVAVDADDAGSGNLENSPAVTASPKGSVDINPAVARLKHLDRLAAEDGNMTRGSRIHATAPGAARVYKRKLDANGPIAPQMSALRRAFRLEKPLRGTIADAAHPKPQTLISRWNLVGCHGISSVIGGLAGPQTGSGLHHLVTAVSVKKALMGLLQSLGAGDRGPRLRPVMLPAHTRPKCEAATRSRIALMAS